MAVPRDVCSRWNWRRRRCRAVAYRRLAAGRCLKMTPEAAWSLIRSTSGIFQWQSVQTYCRGRTEPETASLSFDCCLQLALGKSFSYRDRLTVSRTKHQQRFIGVTLRSFVLLRCRVRQKTGKDDVRSAWDDAVANALESQGRTVATVTWRGRRHGRWSDAASHAPSSSPSRRQRPQLDAADRCRPSCRTGKVCQLSKPVLSISCMNYADNSQQLTDCDLVI